MSSNILYGTTQIYKSYIGSNSTYPTHSDEISVEWILIGGGGGAGAVVSTAGGAGGAGRFMTATSIIKKGQTITISAIGAGGSTPGFPTIPAVGANGGDSVAIIDGVTYTSPGGGGGGAGYSVQYPNESTRDGQDGGSGGGGAETNTGTSSGGSNVAGTPSTLPGSGYQQGSDGDGGTTTSPGEGGGARIGTTGPGSQISWLDGISYCRGGNITGTAATLYGEGGGAYGGTGQTPRPGYQGIFKLRYLGTPKATGGTITESGGYTYHAFTTTGTFTYTG